MFFTQIYIYDNNNKNIYMLIYKKKFKKMYTPFWLKILATAKQLFRKNSYLLFEKPGIFSHSERRDRFDSYPPPVCFHSLFNVPPPPSTANPGFPTGVENMGRSSSKFDGNVLSQYMGGGWRET